MDWMKGRKELVRGILWILIKQQETGNCSSVAILGIRSVVVTFLWGRTIEVRLICMTKKDASEGLVATCLSEVFSCG
jgi:hypothetical protein